MIRTLPFVLLLLVAIAPAFGQKLYKFQDEKGRWQFTDRPPADNSQVEVSQLDVGQKKRIWLHQLGEGDQRRFYLYNEFAGPVEIEMSCPVLENATAQPPLPKRFVVQSGKSEVLLTIDHLDLSRPWRFELKYQSVIGPPVSDFSAKTYLPPIAPGSEFRIDQAFGGKFSHTTPVNFHAVDIAMPLGTPVHAARAGTVMAVDNDFYRGGADEQYSQEANQIIIQHEDGSMAVYAHMALERAQVSAGLPVRAGQLIGYSGNTGFSTGPHLHFGILVNKGMKLESIPFNFLTASGQPAEPREGTMLAGIGAPPGAKPRISDRGDGTPEPAAKAK